MIRSSLIILTTNSFKEKLAVSLPRVTVGTIVDLATGLSPISVGQPVNETSIQAFATVSLSDRNSYDLYSRALAVGYESIVERNLLPVHDVSGTMFFDDLGGLAKFPLELQNNVRISYISSILRQLEANLYCIVSASNSRLEIVKPTDIPYLLFGLLTPACQLEFLQYFTTMSDASVNYLLSHLSYQEAGLTDAWEALPKYSNSMLIMNEIAAKLEKPK